LLVIIIIWRNRRHFCKLLKMEKMINLCFQLCFAEMKYYQRSLRGLLLSSKAGLACVILECFVNFLDYPYYMNHYHGSWWIIYKSLKIEKTIAYQLMFCWTKVLPKKIWEAKFKFPGWSLYYEPLLLFMIKVTITITNNCIVCKRPRIVYLGNQNSWIIGSCSYYLCR